MDVDGFAAFDVVAGVLGEHGEVAGAEDLNAATGGGLFGATSAHR